CPYFDSLLALEDPARFNIATDDNGGVSPCSRIVQRHLVVGTYFVEVRQRDDAVIQEQYVLSIRVVAPACGDGAIQVGEQCDDGNATSGDGCSSACQVEPPREIEPNDTIETATPPWPAGTSWIAAVTPATDVDYFSFTLPATASRVRIDTHDVGSTTTCAFDTTVSLYSPDGRSIASDFDSGPGLCGQVDGATNAGASGLPPGTYYARVVSIAPIAAYAVDVTVF
ncbi:MAG: DVUA0089 family protein, partial [Deltaproteobacteria bacterium]